MISRRLQRIGRGCVAALCLIGAAAPAETVLDFVAGSEGFASVDAGGTVAHAAGVGGGSLRLTNPAGWHWRGKRTFTTSGGENPKYHAFASELAAAGAAGGRLHFDLILRRDTAASNRTSSFWGLQYNLAINQAPPTGNGWVQRTFLELPASAYPPVDSVTTHSLSLPLRPWDEGTGELRIHPASPWFELQFGSNCDGAGGVEWHIDNLRVTTDPVVPPDPATVHLEAENGMLTGVTVASAAAGFSGTGYATGFDATGDKVAWTFPAAAGTYQLRIRFRTPFGEKGFSGVLNGAGISGMFPGTSTFAGFDAGLVELLAGTNTLEVGGGWNWYEIDAVTLTPATPAPPLPVPAIPCDPLATPAARDLLRRTTTPYGSLTLSGQREIADTAHVLTVSGKLPAIIEGDLIDYSPSRVERQGIPPDYTESILAKHAAGHLLQFAWHWNAPAGLVDSTEWPWWSGFYTQATTFDLAAALANPAGPDHALLLRDIDAIAAQLAKAANAGIPLLWRPLHEAEGGWFWWGAKGPEPFKQLWRLLHQRLTQHHGLHHLVWVLTSEHPDWYPGHDVVDVVGVDAYPDNRYDALSSRWQPLLARLDGIKPLALTEFGGVPDVERMHRLGVRWAWFCSWEGAAGPASEPADKVARIYQSPAVVALDELPPPATPFQLWQFARFGAAATDPAIAGDHANPDHDLLDNLLEYALDTDPNRPGPAPLAAARTAAGGFLQLTVPRNPLATDLLFTVEVAANPADPAGWNTTDTLVLTDTPALLVVRDTGTGPRRFIRLRVGRRP